MSLQKTLVVLISIFALNTPVFAAAPMNGRCVELETRSGDGHLSRRSLGFGPEKQDGPENGQIRVGGSDRG